MPERILRAVAEPMKLFWAPFIPAVMNLALHFLCMIFGWVLFQISPLPVIGSIILFHLFLVGQGTKEPHLSSWLQAWAEGMKPTKNLLKGKTKKYVP